MIENHAFTAKEDNRNEHGMCFFYSTALSRKTGIEFKDKLRKLVIIGQQDITYMPGISELIELEELWIVECGIKEPPSFENHRNLEKLCLYMNKMESIPNLTGCIRLKILHMSNNHIRDFKNFDKIPSLQKLILADNEIERLGEDFPRKSQLRFINLSGNPLHHIQDIKNLAVLQKLNSVVFADPLYKVCPISIMCNYRPYMIQNLPHIKKLDHYPICRGEKHWVAYFFREQNSYYNMLLHTHFNCCLESLKDKYVQYQQMIKNMKEQFLAAHEKRDVGKKTKCKLTLQLKSINEQVEEWEEQFMNDLKTYKQQFDLSRFSCGNINFVEYSPNGKNRVIDLCQNILEDSLCSNIREIGIAGIILHKVVKVMNHEITSQIDWEQKSDVVTLDINNVVFEILSSYPGVQSVGHWPTEFFESELFKTEGVLVTDCLAIADEEWLSKNWMLQEQLVTSRSYKNRRICILIQTSTHIQQRRIACKQGYNHTLMTHNHKDCKKVCYQNRLESHRIKSPMFVIEYEYIPSELVKTDSQDDENDNTIHEQNKNLHMENDNTVQLFDIAPENIFNLAKICLSGQNLKTIALDLDLPNLRELDISYNCITTFPNGRFLKHVKCLDISFNNIKVLSITEVLPMLENMNISWNNLCNCLTTCQTFIKFTPNLNELNIEYNLFEDCLDQKQIHCIMKTCLPKLNLPANVWSTGFNDLSSENLSLCTEYTCKQICQQLAVHNVANCDKISSGIKSKEQQDYKQLKRIHVQHNTSFVTNVFKKKTKVELLCASFCYLTKIPVIKPMQFLIKLNLSSNFISSTDNFTQQNFPVLKYLDLSKNLITSLRLMQHFHSLREFYCAHNYINNISELENLRSWYMLNILDLYKNPVDANDQYKKFIICHLPNIKYISGKYIEYTQIVEAKYEFGIVLDVNILSYMFKTDYLQAITQLSLTNCSLKKVHMYSDMIPCLESLNLSRNKISMVWGLHSFKYLHTLCLSYNALEKFGKNSKDTASFIFLNLCILMLDHNNISRLENLSRRTMPKIKHIFLNDNSIHALDEITNCSSLETLILDYNNIETLTTELQEDNNLKLLSLEYNKIESLQFIQTFQKLERLYLANNSITNESEIEFLKSLKNLKELTLIGNPIHPIMFENDGY